MALLRGEGAGEYDLLSPADAEAVVVAADEGESPEEVEVEPARAEPG